MTTPPRFPSFKRAPSSLPPCSSPVDDILSFLLTSQPTSHSLLSSLASESEDGDSACDSACGWISYEASASVRIAGICAFSDVVERTWDVFRVPGAFADRGEWAVKQRKVRDFCVRVMRAVSDRLGEEKDEVCVAAFRAVDGIRTEVLYERVARHLLGAIPKVVDRAVAVRSACSTRVATKLLKFALNEHRPHPFAGIAATPAAKSVMATTLSFVHLYLMPLMNANDAPNGDVALTAAESALQLAETYYTFSSYESTQIRVACANVALIQLRALDSNESATALPVFTQKQRRERCTKILFSTADSPKHLPSKQRIKILGRCAAICASDSNLMGLLSTCCDRIVQADAERRSEEDELANHGDEENPVKLLLMNERGVLRTVWRGGSESTKHRLAKALLDAVGRFRQDDHDVWLDLSLEVLQFCMDCLAWNDSTAGRDHLAGNAYADLFAKRAVYTSGGFQRLLKQIVEFKLESCPDVFVRARLLEICVRVYVEDSKSDMVLGTTLAGVARHLALTDVGGVDSGVFVLALNIMSHLSKNVPHVRGLISSAFVHISSTQQLSTHEHRTLDEKITEMEAIIKMGNVKVTSTGTEPFPKFVGDVIDLVPVIHKTRSPRMEYETQLSGGSDPIYVMGSMRVSNNRVVCCITLCNVSLLVVENLVVDLSFTCGDAIRLTPGEPFRQTFHNPIVPGGFAQFAFTVDLLLEGKADNIERPCISARITCDDFVAIEFDPWYLPFAIFLSPLCTLDFKAFRSHFGRCVGGSLKLEIVLFWPNRDVDNEDDHEEEGGFYKSFEKSFQSFFKVAVSSRSASYAAEFFTKRTPVYMTLQVFGGNKIGVELRSSDADVLKRIDLNALICEQFSPPIGAVPSIAFSMNSHWPNSLTPTNDCIGGEDLNDYAFGATGTNRVDVASENDDLRVVLARRDRVMKSFVE